jgi:hypothetical protein
VCVGGLLISLAGLCGPYRSSLLVPILKRMEHGDGKQINVNGSSATVCIDIYCSSAVNNR